MITLTSFLGLQGQRVRKVHKAKLAPKARPVPMARLAPKVRKVSKAQWDRKG